MAKIIDTKGNVTEKEMSFQDCQLAVGGYVEPVYLPDGRVLLANEEGLLHGLPINVEASIIVGETIVGTVVLIEDPDEVTDILD